MDELEKLLDEAEAMARDSIRKNGEVFPMVLCETAAGERFIIGYNPAPSSIQRRVQALFNARHAELLMPLLLGLRTRMDERLRALFTETGTMHLLRTQNMKKA